MPPRFDQIFGAFHEGLPEMNTTDRTAGTGSSFAVECDQDTRAMKAFDHSARDDPDDPRVPGFAGEHHRAWHLATRDRINLFRQVTSFQESSAFEALSLCVPFIKETSQFLCTLAISRREEFDTHGRLSQPSTRVESRP